MAVAYFMTWSLFNKKTLNTLDAVSPEEGSYIRELGGAEKFLSRKIPGSDKVFGSIRSMLIKLNPCISIKQIFNLSD